MSDHNGLTTPGTAAQVLATHVAEAGWCRGCRDLWEPARPLPLHSGRMGHTRA